MLKKDFIKGLNNTPLSIASADSVVRCAVCVIPKSLQLVSFSEDNVCSFCKAAELQADRNDKTDESRARLDEVIEKIRSEGYGRQFDCIVGLSGGRDSCYLLYLLTQKHKLRCLAAYYRTPFTPDVIDENVKRITSQLGGKLVKIQIPTRFHLNVARDSCLLWKRHPVAEIANLACSPCKLVHRELFRIARAHGIKFMILGGNKYEELQFLPTFQVEDLTESGFSFLNQVRKASRILKKGTILLFKCPSVVKYLPLGIKTALLYLNPLTVYLRLRYPDISCIEYFFYVPWKESECIETIQSKLGWRLPPGCTTTWRADCDFADLKNYMFYKMNGVTYTEGLLSNLIRAGQITREEAIKRLESNPYISRERVQRALQLLNLPLDFVKELPAEAV